MESLRKNVPDQLDRQIVGILLKDARTSFTDIGKKLGVSTATVLSRYEKLVESGVIKGSTLIVDNAKLGQPLTALVGIRIIPGQGQGLFDELCKYPEVLEIHQPTGTYDIIAKIVAESVEKLHDFLSGIQSAKGLERTETFMVLKTHLHRNIKIS